MVKASQSICNSLQNSVAIERNVVINREIIRSLQFRYRRKDYLLVAKIRQFAENKTLI